MISFRVIFDREIARNIQRRAEKGVVRSLFGAAAIVRATARRFIKVRKGPSPEGAPPHSRRGKAKRPDAVLFAVDRPRETAFVGFMAPVLGESMAAHEHGGEYLGGDFPKRPTMGPALEASQVRFGNAFDGILGD